MLKKILLAVGIIVAVGVFVDYIRTKVQLHRAVASQSETEKAGDSPKKESPVQPDQPQTGTGVSSKEPVVVEPVQQQRRASAYPGESPYPSNGGGPANTTFVGPTRAPQPEAPVVSSLPQGFPSSGIPARPAYQNEEEQKTARQREEYLVSQMFSSYIALGERKASIGELGNYPYFRVAKALSMVLLRDQNAELRMEAAVSLGKTGNTSFVPALEQAINSDPDPRVKEAAERALADVKSRASQPTL